MTNFIFAPLFGAATNLLLAVFVFLRAPRSRLSQIYLAWGIALTLWCAGAGAMFVVQEQHVARVWARVLHLGVIWIPVTGLHVCLLLSSVRASIFLRVCYLVTIGLTVGDLLGLHIAGVTRVEYGWFAQAGPGFWIFAAFMPIATLPAILVLLRRLRRVEVEDRRKFRILIAANSLLLLSGTHDLAPVLGYFQYPGTHLNVYPWGTYAAGLYGLLVAYGTLQDQILDVRVTLSQYAAYLVRLGFLFSLVLLLLIIAAAIGPAGSFGTYSFFATMAAVFLATVLTGWLFPKLFGGGGEGLERHLLGDSFEYQEQIIAVSNTLHRHTKLEPMWREVADLLTGAMRVSPVHCVIFGMRKVSVRMRETAPNVEASRAALARINAESLIARYFGDASAELLDARADPLLGLRLEEREAQAEAAQLGAEYVFPLRGGDKRLLGLMAIGRKANKVPFTAADLELLGRLAQRVSWATERTLLAEQAGFAERHELLAMMSRGLAHDMNNLLTPVSTILQICGSRYLHTEPERQLLGAADSSVRAIRNYVQEAIFFAKDLRPQMNSISLPELMDDVRAITQPKAVRKGVAVNFSTGQGSVILDFVLCQRVLQNLISNAIDASITGRSVEVVAETDPVRDVARFVVKDHGHGIPRENLDRVWQPYFTTKDTGDGERGFGLGLTVCNLIVELHQGVISLSSEVGVGTTVTVEFPRSGAGQPAWVPTHYAS